MITDVCIIGERVSGTCFLSKLVTSNTTLKLNNSFGHKHFFQDIEKIKKSNTAHILFLFITRDIIEWLQSFMSSTYHASDNLRSCQDFSKFIRTEWSCVYDETSGIRSSNSLYKKEMMHERDPETRKRFSNAIKMRTSKINENMKIKNFVENFVHIKYEDVRDDPQIFLESMCSMFCIPRYVDFVPIDTVKGRGSTKYVRKIYPAIEHDDLLYIMEEMDEDVEKKIGYI